MWAKAITLAVALSAAALLVASHRRRSALAKGRALRRAVPATPAPAPPTPPKRRQPGEPTQNRAARPPKALSPRKPPAEPAPAPEPTPDPEPAPAPCASPADCVVIGPPADVDRASAPLAEAGHALLPSDVDAPGAVYVLAVREPRAARFWLRQVPEGARVAAAEPRVAAEARRLQFSVQGEPGDGPSGGPRPPDVSKLARDSALEQSETVLSLLLARGGAAASELLVDLTKLRAQGELSAPLRAFLWPDGDAAAALVERQGGFVVMARLPAQPPTPFLFDAEHTPVVAAVAFAPMAPHALLAELAAAAPAGASLFLGGFAAGADGVAELCEAGGAVWGDAAGGPDVLRVGGASRAAVDALLDALPSACGRERAYGDCAVDRAALGARLTPCMSPQACVPLPVAEHPSTSEVDLWCAVGGPGCLGRPLRLHVPSVRAFAAAAERAACAAASRATAFQRGMPLPDDAPGDDDTFEETEAALHHLLVLTGDDVWACTLCAAGTGKGGGALPAACSWAGDAGADGSRSTCGICGKRARVRSKHRCARCAVRSCKRHLSAERHWCPACEKGAPAPVPGRQAGALAVDRARVTLTAGATGSVVATVERRAIVGVEAHGRCQLTLVSRGGAAELETLELEFATEEGRGGVLSALRSS